MISNNVMVGSKVDTKSIELITMLAFLREDIDVHRIIALNADALASTDLSTNVSRVFFGYLQHTALGSLAISFCKIFEDSPLKKGLTPRYDLNSIPGIIHSFDDIDLSSKQKGEFSAFGQKHGNCTEPVEAKAYLRDTFDTFKAAHAEGLGRLKDFRNKIGAHSEFEASPEFKILPSRAEFEVLYGFAVDFYQLIASSIIDVYPAPVPSRVAPGLMELMKRLGVPAPKFDFDPD